jgi:hypothetical protein
MIPFYVSARTTVHDALSQDGKWSKFVNAARCFRSPDGALWGGGVFVV